MVTDSRDLRAQQSNLFQIKYDHSTQIAKESAQERIYTFFCSSALVMKLHDECSSKMFWWKYNITFAFGKSAFPSPAEDYKCNCLEFKIAIFCWFHYLQAPIFKNTKQYDINDIWNDIVNSEMLGKFRLTYKCDSISSTKTLLTIPLLKKEIWYCVDILQPTILR